MKLRVTGILLAILMMLSVTLTAFAAAAEDAQTADEVSGTGNGTVESASPFYLDGEQLADLEYQLIGGTNYVTVASFLSAMSGEAMVEEENGTVVASCVTVTEIVDMAAVEDEAAVSGGAGEIAQANVIEETLTFSAREGDCYVVANGHYLYVESCVMTVEGKVAAPIRALARIFNLDVSYDRASRRVLLTRREGEGACIAGAAYDEDTLYWLSHIICAESGNQPMLGKIAVGNVVMNRVANPLFPNTIKGVLFQKNQFSPAASGSIYRTPNEESVIAAKLVLDGACVVPTALFFNRAGLNTYAARNRTYVATIGAHAFYD